VAKKSRVGPKKKFHDRRRCPAIRKKKKNHAKGAPNERGGPGTRGNPGGEKGKNEWDAFRGERNI